MKTTTDQLTDLGPAPTPPAWCLPGTAPNTESTGEGYLWSWSREFGEHVWIECEDTIANGRVLRGEPRIVYSEPPADGVSPAQAKELARALMAAAGELDELEDGASSA
jgi:hypothetical protein